MKKLLSGNKNLKIKYLLILLVIIIFNIGAVGLFTNSRYFASINLKAVQDIGYTIFKLAPDNLESVEGYDAKTKTLEIAPREDKTVTYKISNVENDYYNEMNLKSYVKVLDESGNELTSDSKFSAEVKINGVAASYVTGKGYGPINMDWSGNTLDEKTISIKLTCSNRCIKTETISYYIVAEAFNTAAQADETDENHGVIVRRSEALKLKIYDEYSIEYELNNTDNKAIWLPDNEGPTGYKLGETINLKAPIARTQDFDGWYEETDFSGTKITNTYENGNEDLKFYAKWVDKANLHTLKVITSPADATIKYKSNEENVGLDETKTGGFQEIFVKGTKVDVTASKTGYETITKQYEIGDTDITETLTLRKLFTFKLTGKVDNGENANIEYSIDVPENALYPNSQYKDTSGTDTDGVLEGTYPEGTKINITVKKDGCETVTLPEITLSDNYENTVTIRKLYALNISGKAKAGGVTSDAKISYVINAPASEFVPAYNSGNLEVTGTLSPEKSFPKGTTVSVTVSKDGFDSETASFEIKNENINKTITLLMNWTYTLNVTSPESSNITFEIASGTLVSGNLTGTVSNTIVVKEGTSISWAARASGYYTKFGNVTITSNKSDTISLEVLPVIDTFWSGHNLAFSNKSVVQGSVSKIDNIKTPNSEHGGLGKFAELEKNANTTVQFDFTIPTTYGSSSTPIPQNAIFKQVVFRTIAGGENIKIDFTVQVWYNGVCIKEVTGITSNKTRNDNGSISVTIDLNNLQIPEGGSRTLSIRVINPSSHDLGMKACDIERFYFTPPAE